MGFSRVIGKLTGGEVEEAGVGDYCRCEWALVGS